MSFSQLGLCAPILSAIAKQGYTTPSPIQQQVIPVILNGQDVLASAQTGTGKTAGFSLPMLHRLSESPRNVRGGRVRALILTPTRELAAQVGQNVRDYSADLRIRSTVVFGGVGINPQMMALRKGADVLIATPGRLLDLYQQNAVTLKELEILVLDEADTMLDMGFIHDIKRILKLIPAKRQTLLFSATFAPDVMALAESVTNNPVKLSVTPQNSTVEVIEQKLIAVDKQQKIPALIALLKQNDAKQTLVFARTKHGADKVVRKLSGAGIRSAAIHGNKSQGARTKALSALKDGTIQVLVATDIAARGIDIDRLPAVINLDLPNVPANYVHRIGRTGRAGEGGRAWSLVCADEVAELRDIESFIKQNIPRESLEGFEPSEPLPTHPVKIKAATVKKPKKPKKPREGQAARRRSGAPKRSGNKPRSEGKAPPPSSKGAWANAGSRA